ncbi:MAG: hypothetical protein D6743_10090 [Calditrichaeota bacterium]|nr:MAG: hypothetical protein D6743_10090 [Calditrichota bacterium]
MQTKGVKFGAAEEGYVLFVVPGSDNAPASEEAVPALASLQRVLLGLKNGLVLNLANQADFQLKVEPDYHQWAGTYAHHIDSRQLRAEALVDVDLFWRKVKARAASRGLVVRRDQPDVQRAEVECHGFRVPFNLYREIACMVFSARHMEDEITEFLARIKAACEMLTHYYLEFAGIFAQHTVFIGDHHFVVSRGDDVRVPGLNYWSLIGSSNPDFTFWLGVDAVKRFLAAREKTARPMN